MFTHKATVMSDNLINMVGCTKSFYIHLLAIFYYIIFAETFTYIITKNFRTLFRKTIFRLPVHKTLNISKSVSLTFVVVIYELMRNSAQ